MKASAPFPFVWNCIQVELYSCLRKGRTFLLSFITFAELGWPIIQYHYYCELQTRQLSLNWCWNIHNCVCGAHISLCGLNFFFPNFVWNVFYTLAIRNAFSFHKLGKYPFFEHFLKISCNFKILSGQNISSDEKTQKLDTRTTPSSNEK